VNPVIFRPAAAGETPTHFWHMRTDSYLTRDAANVAGFGSDCMLPLVKIVAPHAEFALAEPDA
jgi:hypothetical protein